MRARYTGMEHDAKNIEHGVHGVHAAEPHAAALLERVLHRGLRGLSNGLEGLGKCLAPNSFMRRLSPGHGAATSLTAKRRRAT